MKILDYVIIFFLCFGLKLSTAQSITISPDNSEMIKLDRNGESYQKFFHNNLYKAYLGIVGAENFYLNTTLDNNLGKLQFGTKNISRLVIHPTGKIGVGISDNVPISNLQIAGGTEDLANSGGDFSIGSSSNHLKIGVAVSGLNSGFARLYAAGTTPNLIFGADNKDIMSVSYSGVGIGTLTPSEFFEVEGGDVKFSNNNLLLKLKNTSITGKSELRFLNSSDAAKAYVLYDQSINKLNIGHYEASQSTGMYVDNSNSFGFGINTPTAKMHLKHTSYNATPTLTLEENTSNQGALIEFKNNNTNKWSILGNPNASDVSALFKIGYSSASAGEILTLSGDGKMTLKEGTTNKIEFFANNTFSGSRMTMRDVNGNRSIEMFSTDGSSNKPGRLTFRNPSDDSIIMDLDADYSNSGKSRIRVDELEILGGADFAEFFKINNTGAVEPGTVVSLDEKEHGSLVVSTKANDSKAIGIVSGANGVSAGIMLHQKGNSVVDGSHPVAIAGRVYVKADASKKAIRLGDLLTTSALDGHVMKATSKSRKNGAVIGKALSELTAGEGFVLILLGNR
ncbi:hypothetical protein EGI22_19060 [Lacihabitans sp. LS3-19]|uniref:hypothetical protein n=1 Tax=Lacihabitans sp. LS3-19 TaxID=2487335 RepID=UPI0020CDCC21|nr:hypothetical protein [Lacihabitans sp. LS3-19]MCP9770007.1 hypothetical protein [Lacihabitans sp. LS3-19]